MSTKCTNGWAEITVDSIYHPDEDARGVFSVYSFHPAVRDGLREGRVAHILHTDREGVRIGDVIDFDEYTQAIWVQFI